MLSFFTFELEQERDKFTYIFNHYKKLMLHKAYGILKDYSLAEDAVSESFIRIYKNISKIDEPDSPKSAAFIIIIVKNVSLTMLHREKSHTYEEYDDAMEDGFRLEDKVLARMELVRAYEMLERLSEELRSVFLLKYAYDLPHSEIGKLLGISENNVTVRLHRAKKKLVAQMQEEGFADV